MSESMTPPEFPTNGSGSRAAARAEQRQQRAKHRRTLLIVLAAIVALVLVVGGAVVVSSGGDDAKPAAAPTTTLPTASGPPVNATFIAAAYRTATTKGTDVPVYASPDANAAPVTTLPKLTEYLLPRSFLVFDEYADWLHVYLPTRPNSSTAWVKASHVRVGAPLTYQIRVSLAERTLTLSHNGQVQFTARQPEPVRVGEVGLEAGIMPGMVTNPHDRRIGFTRLFQVYGNLPPHVPGNGIEHPAQGQGIHILQ